MSSVHLHSCFAWFLQRFIHCDFHGILISVDNWDFFLFSTSLGEKGKQKLGITSTSYILQLMARGTIIALRHVKQYCHIKDINAEDETNRSPARQRWHWELSVWLLLSSCQFQEPLHCFSPAIAHLYLSHWKKAELSDSSMQFLGPHH